MGSNKRSNSETGRDPALFTVPTPRLPAGRVRKGLEADVHRALDVGAELPAAGVAALRSLADQIDLLERQLRHPTSGAYDRVPFAGLLREFRESYETVFASLTRAEDPLTHALASFLAQTGDPAHTGPPD